MNNKIVILNCPPRSGKDTIADLLHAVEGYNVGSFKNRLIEIALIISNIPKDEWYERYDTKKDEPWDRLGRLSQRNYLIKISEDWVKPIHGKTYFGDRVTEDILRNDGDKFVFPDGGFVEEVYPLIETFGESSILILQWGREGCSFEKDSRDWITKFPAMTKRIRDNNSMISDQYIAAKGEIDVYFRSE